MRKVIVLEHISLDGVIQAPGGPDEETSGGFAYGGWIARYSDAILKTVLRRQMNMPLPGSPSPNMVIQPLTFVALILA